MEGAWVYIMTNRPNGTLHTGVTSNLPKTESIAILIEKNPNILAAVFDLPAGTEATVSTRVKMAQSSNIHALVKADGRYYVATKEVKVTLGGCGG